MHICTICEERLIEDCLDACSFCEKIRREHNSMILRIDIARLDYFKETGRLPEGHRPMVRWWVNV